MEMIGDAHVHIGGPYSKMSELMRRYAHMQGEGAKRALKNYSKTWHPHRETLGDQLNELCEYVRDNHISSLALISEEADLLETSLAVLHNEIPNLRLQPFYWIKDEHSVPPDFIKGLKFHPAIDGPNALKTDHFKLAQEKQLPLLVHTEEGISPIEPLVKLAKKHDVKIILAHAGDPAPVEPADPSRIIACFEQAVQATLENENIFLEFSAFAWAKKVDFFASALKTNSRLAQKCLFGSDWPIWRRSSLFKGVDDQERLLLERSVSGKIIAQIRANHSKFEALSKKELKELQVDKKLLSRTLCEGLVADEKGFSKPATKGKPIPPHGRGR